MLVRDVMSRPVVSVRPHVPVRTAAALLVEHGFTDLPVVDASGRLCGLVGEAELLRGSTAEDGRVRAAEVAVEAVMSPRPPVVGPDSDLADAAALVVDGRARSVPVVQAGRLVGVLTPRDLLRVIAREPDRAGT